VDQQEGTLSTGQETRWSGFDVLGYILAKSGLNRITSDRQRLQDIFREFQQEADETRKKLLLNFVFATRDIVFFSGVLDGAIDRLLSAGLMECLPRLAKFEICSEEAKKFMAETQPLFNQNEIEALNQLADEFRMKMAQAGE